MHRLQEYFGKRGAGIYSVCSAHPWVIRAAAQQAVTDGAMLLLEATSNQVNQFGGYTGLRPAAFRSFVEQITEDAHLPPERLILGGDHLGPNPWRSVPAKEAMQHAETMIAEYVASGFTKIHLDASMPCSDDPAALSDEIVAERAARLCRIAEDARTADEAPIYVIGTEVPTPGGATHSLRELQVTTPEAAEHTLAIHEAAFRKAMLMEAWNRVIALVLQPGVEFDHDSVVDYDPAKAVPLRLWLEGQSKAIVFEAHSTDYQRGGAYRELIEDGFAILKVGPALTFALREALYALQDIEAQIVPSARRSHLSDVVEAAMLAHPANWRTHYVGSADQQKLLRVYSYSDRLRYHWNDPEVAASVEKLVANLSLAGISETMLSRYLPAQYRRVREGILRNEPEALVVDRVQDVMRLYAAACRPSRL